MNRLPALLFAAATCTFAYASDREDKKIFDVTLEPEGVHEECTRVEAGQKRHYYWKSSAPVDFNIHYHRGDEVFYPVKRVRMRGDGGTFTAKTGEDYCWMWSAKNGAKVEGRIDLKPR
jgi:hypothetical protein